MPQAGQEATSADIPITKCHKNRSKARYKCVCLNARRIVNKKSYIKRYCPSSRRQCWKYNMTGVLMTEYLDGYFSSVFIIEDIISLPVPDAKFQEAKCDYLGTLIVPGGTIWRTVN